MKILVTGVAGFIGFHLCRRLLKDGQEVVGIDNVNDYYDVNLKFNRLKILERMENFTFMKIDISNKDEMEKIFGAYHFSKVINLAAQAGVRYSLENPHEYINANILGFTNVLEGCRHTKVSHLVYASSSSVYGLNSKMPFSVHDNVDHPVSLYAATKKSNELMAHSYSYLYDLPTTGLRFFTVYGPWGRPDMALFLFTRAIQNGDPIKVFNHGNMKRDFTYVDDIIEGVVRIMDCTPEANPQWNGVNPDPGSSPAPFRIYNIGNNNSVRLLDFIAAIENALNKKSIKEYLPLQPGDVPETFADVSDLTEMTGFKPNTKIEDGINRFVAWYLDYYQNGEST